MGYSPWWYTELDTTVASKERQQQQQFASGTEKKGKFLMFAT